jgi:hypothetical protein
VKTIYLIQHCHWYTEIQKLSKKESKFPYRIKTTSGIRSIEPTTLCNTLDEAKKIAAEHMEEVKGI